jgi:hypothetical protein
MNDDALDDLLQPALRESSAGLCGALRERTTGVVRWRRYRRRAWQVIAIGAAQGVVAAAVAWLLASGALTWQQQTTPPENLAVRNAVAPVDVPAPENDPAPSAVALEWKAFDAPADQQAELYFKAGQRYFEDHQDFGSALRCYRQAFDAGSEKLLAVSPSDNWLVMAIKIDCRKEN